MLTQFEVTITKNPNLPTKFEQMHDSLERIKRQPQEVWMPKLADRISNLQPPPHYWTDEKIQQYRDEAITIYEALEAANEVLASRLLKQIEVYKIFITGK